MSDGPDSSDERPLCPACGSPAMQVSVGEFDDDRLDCGEEFDETAIE